MNHEERHLDTHNYETYTVEMSETHTVHQTLDNVRNKLTQLRRELYISTRIQPAFHKLCDAAPDVFTPIREPGFTGDAIMTTFIRPNDPKTLYGFTPTDGRFFRMPLTKEESAHFAQTADKIRQKSDTAYHLNLSHDGFGHPDNATEITLSDFIDAFVDSTTDIENPIIKQKVQRVLKALEGFAPAPKKDPTEPFFVQKEVMQDSLPIS